MFPIRDHNPSRRPAYVTYMLMALNIAIFLAMWPSFSDQRAILAIYNDWAMVPARITFGEGYYTFVSSMFLHGGLLHLAGNMLFLWIFGDNLEDQMGRGRYLGFYLLCGIAAAFLQYIAAPSSRIPMVGASGAIAGVMGGYLLLYPKARVDVLVIFVIFFKVFQVPAWAMLGPWFVFQLIGGFDASADAGGVAYLAHVGGFGIGIIATFPLWRRLGGRSFWGQTLGHPRHEPTQYRFESTRIPVVRRRK